MTNKQNKETTMKVGERIKLNGEMYTFIGPHKRSWLISKDSTGKTYKCTAAMIGKIQNQNKMGIGTKSRERKKTNHMADRLRYRLIFDKTAKMPVTESECLDWLSMICGDLSPENLHCDGEISRSAAMAKARKLRAEWREVEAIIGRKVSENEAEGYWIDQMRSRAGL
jgi:hypothetical protein